MTPKSLDAMSGLWEADLSRSRLVGPPPRAIRMKIARAGDALQHAVLVTRANGDEQRLVLTYEPRSIRETDDGELLVEIVVGANTYRDYWSLSADGETLTMTHRDDALAGQTTVLERRAALPATSSITTWFGPPAPAAGR
jgi:hypothetical protein